ncbi:hypothetical protein HYQ46_005281 [Verticillium longisporum]|nr:hypothetical protein HYQ46_005281 [Verticillium longisporum]
MAKSKSRKRKQTAQADLPNKNLKTVSTITPPPDGATQEPKSLQTVVSEEEFEITVETLTALAQYPNLIKSKFCKDLREPKSLQTVVSEEELEITVETLTALAQYPNLIKSKFCKDLRVAAYEFRQACATGVNSAAAGMSLTARITAALTDGKYMDARIMLAEMRIRGEEPKLGALCRWVRDLDMISGLSTLPAGQGTEGLLMRTWTLRRTQRLR